jgi:uncharacterized protein YqcC (DUF446 family)
MRDELRDLLTALEQELHVQHRWESTPPDEQALSSTEPFAVDTLEFDQWLQWIFLPKLHQLLDRQLPLPQRCAVHPMAEEVYPGDDPAGQRLLAILSNIDALLSGQGNALN